MSEQVNSDKFVLGLEQNALDSLMHGVEHFINAEKPTDLKYTILHIFHAVELFLKARLAKVEPFLIFKKPKSDHTVDFKTLVERLCEKGITLSEQNCRDLNELRKIRNLIEHYQINESHSSIEHFLGRTMYFLDSFLRNELDINLEERLDAETYRILSQALYSYQERLAKAKEGMRKVQQELEKGVRFKERAFLYSLLFCEECGEETVIIPDPTVPRGTVHCFFCDAHFTVTTCERCSSYILLSTSLQESHAADDDEDDDLPELCESCWEEIELLRTYD